MMLALRSILFALLLPGTVTMVIPYFILYRNRVAQVDQWPLGHWLGLLPIGVGLAILVWCIRDFAVVGRGTLAPIDPPRRLVARGPYRYVRNPMYVGVICILAGEALTFQSRVLLFYLLCFMGAVQCFVVLYEEPTLRRKFGESYEAYCRRVHRWVPQLPREPAG